MDSLLKREYIMPYISEVKLDCTISLICESGSDSGEDDPPTYPTGNYIFQEKQEIKTPFRKNIFEEDTSLNWE